MQEKVLTENVPTENVLTLVHSKKLDSSVTSAATEALRRLGAQVAAPRWLAVGSACDLFFDGVKEEIAESEVRAIFDGAEVDLAAQPVAGRRKQLLIADMESTLIRNEMLDELADFAGVRPRVEEITARAMAGELDFAGSLKERVALLKGLPVSVLDEAMERVVIDSGARILVATLSAHGATTALVSGGFRVFAEPIGEQLGCDICQANTLLIEDGHLSGEVGEPILGRDAKVRTLQELCRQLAISPADVAAVGDGANDLAMIAAAGLGVAYHAKPAVVAAARFRVQWGDLRTLLYFQGIEAADFVH